MRLPRAGQRLLHLPAIALTTSNARECPVEAAAPAAALALEGQADADLAIAQAKLAYVEIIADWQQMRMRDDRARTSHALAATAERAAVDVARIVAEAERDRSELTSVFAA